MDISLNKDKFKYILVPVVVYFYLQWMHDLIL